jgi:lipopolysaccharide transport system permease protein
VNLAHKAYVLFLTTRASYLVQEKNSSLGLVWHLLNPVVMAAVLFAVFRGIEPFNQVEHYPLFILVGVIHYNFFINTTTRCAVNFQGSRSLILNTTVPLEVLVLRQGCIEGLTLMIEVLLVIVLGWFLGAEPGLLLTLYPLVFLAFLALSLGMSLALCALVVFFADLTYVWQVGCRLLFFVTPVFFATTALPDGLALSLIELNPLTAMLALARSTLLYGDPVHAGQWLWAMAGPLLALAVGWLMFRAARPRIADYV